MSQIVVIFAVSFRYGKVEERDSQTDRKDARMCEGERGEAFIARD
jgi:hypothetical protein